MILVDANVLIYAVNRDATHHRAAHSWMSSALAGNETVGLPWTSVLAFLRITTNARILPNPLPVPDAIGYVDLWLSRPTCLTIEPGPRHLDALGSFLVEAGTAANLTNDAHLAALALERRAAVATFDRDLERFGVRIVIPG